MARHARDALQLRQWSPANTCRSAAGVPGAHSVDYLLAMQGHCIRYFNLTCYGQVQDGFPQRSGTLCSFHDTPGPSSPLAVPAFWLEPSTAGDLYACATDDVGGAR